LRNWLRRHFGGCGNRGGPPGFWEVTHTLNAGGGLTVIDAQRLRPRMPFTRRARG